MKIFKKMISILMVTAFLLSTVSLIGTNLYAFAESDIISDGICGEEAFWSFDESTSTLTISGTGAMSEYTYNSEIPWNHLNEKTKKLVVEEGITTVSDGFRCLTNLSEVYIADSVKTVNCTFSYTQNSLTYFSLPARASINGKMFDERKKSASEITMENGRFEFKWAKGDQTTTVNIGKDHFVFEFISHYNIYGYIEKINLSSDVDDLIYDNGMLFDNSYTYVYLIETPETSGSLVFPDTVKITAPFKFKNITTIYFGKNYGGDSIDRYFSTPQNGDEESLNQKFEKCENELDEYLLLCSFARYNFSSAQVSYPVEEITVSPENKYYGIKDKVFVLRYNGYNFHQGYPVKQLNTITLDKTDVLLPYSYIGNTIDEVCFTNEFIDRQVEYFKSLYTEFYPDATAEQIERIALSEIVEYFTGALVKKYTVSEDNKYFKSVNGVLFSKDGSVLYGYPLGSERTYFKIPDVDYISYSAFSMNCGNITRNSNLTIHVPEYICKGDVKIVDHPAGLELSEVSLYFLPSLTKKAGKVCIENGENYSVEYSDDNIIEYINRFVDNTNEQMSAEAESLNQQLENEKISQDYYDSMMMFTYKNNSDKLRYVENCQGDHRSNCKFSIITPDRTEIKEKSPFELEAKFDASNIPENSKIEWSVEGVPSISSVSDDSLVCEITPDNSGILTVTAKLVDEFNEVLYTNTVEINIRCYIPNEANDVSVTFDQNCFEVSAPLELYVEKIPNNKKESSIYAFDESLVKSVCSYNIKILNKETGEIVQPSNNKKVEVRIPIPEKYQGELIYNIVHILDNKKKENFSTTSTNSNKKATISPDGKYLIVEVSGFSEFEVCVPVDSAEAKVTKLSKSQYTYKSEFDLSTIELTVTDEEGNSITITDTSEMTVTGFDSTKIGTQTVTVEYGGIKADFEVTVKYAWWQIIIRILLLGFLWY